MVPMVTMFRGGVGGAPSRGGSPLFPKRPFLLLNIRTEKNKGARLPVVRARDASLGLRVADPLPPFRNTGTIVTIVPDTPSRPVECRS
jgi:hypothetical protein